MDKRVFLTLLISSTIRSQSLFQEMSSMEKCLEIPNPEILNSFIAKFYEKQTTIKIFNFFNESISEPVTKLLINHKKILVLGDKDSTWKKPIFKQNFGYFAEIEAFNRDSLSLLEKSNANGPLLLHCHRQSRLDTEIFKFAWEKYRMLDFVVMTYNLEKNCYEMIFYNPFTNTLHKQLLNDFLLIESTFQLIDSRLRNLHGYEMKILLNPSVKTYAIPVYDKNKSLTRFKGIDGELLEGIRYAMNFTTKFVKIQKNLKFHDAEDFVTDLIHNKNLDLLAMTTAINESRVVNVYPLIPIEPIFIVCVVRTRREKYTIDVLSGFADLPTTVLLYVSLLSLSIALFFATRCLHGPFLQDNYFKFYIEIIGILCGVSRLLENYNKTSLRLILASAFFFNLSLNSVFQASIFTDLNHESDVSQINSIEKLIEENITIYAYQQYKHAIKRFENDTDAKLKHQILLNDQISNSQILKEMADGTLQDNFGTLISRHQALYYHAKYLDTKTGMHAVHLVKNPIFSMLMSFHLPEWSPFVEIMNEMSIRLLETGLRQKGLNDAEIFTYLEKIRTMKELNIKGVLSNLKPKPITVENVTNIFFMYYLYMSVSFVIFLLEIIYFWSKQKFLNKKVILGNFEIASSSN